MTFNVMVPYSIMKVYLSSFNVVFSNVNIKSSMVSYKSLRVFI